ncbi:MAG: GGDEF domain-containing protein [Ruminococcus sp.]|nr:GGDEF domain-containing protein [Ruminococcus sp.]
MDYQEIVDGIGAAACVVSVEKLEDGEYGKVRIVTGNRVYLDTIEKPADDLQMLTRTFVPDSEYTNYLTRDLNFESFCYRAAVLKKCLHSYAYPARFDAWFNMSFIPLEDDNDDGLCHCLYIMEVNSKPDAKRLSSISDDVAASVLETCIKLRSPEDFRTTMASICGDIRRMCESEFCCILLMDNVRRKCSVLCESLADDTDLVSMENYIDDSFYDMAETWKDAIAGSNCLIVRNSRDMEVVRERDPVWYKSMKDAGIERIILFPLEFKNELLGYIWTLNFNTDASEMIKETLELTTFILASEIYSYQLVDRLHVLSSRDMLTGVMNRNEMNNFVDALVRDTSGKSAGVLFADLNGLKAVNDSQGHNAGDTLLKNAASALKEVFTLRDIFRAGGDEFVVILKGVTEEELTEKEKQLREAALKYNGLVFAVGHACTEKASDVRTALRLADERMYEDKKKYYGSHPEKKGR